jgi:hypothetical protein
VLLLVEKDLILKGDELFSALHEPIAIPEALLQVQYQGPVPETAEGMPMLQRLVIGAESNVPPLAGPQTSLVGL